MLMLSAAVMPRCKHSVHAEVAPRLSVHRYPSGVVVALLAIVLAGVVP
jgi:hypothetical protein